VWVLALNVAVLIGEFWSSVCVCKRETDTVCKFVCMGERERECVFAWVSALNVTVLIGDLGHQCVCARERERTCVRVFV